MSITWPITRRVKPDQDDARRPAASLVGFLVLVGLLFTAIHADAGRTIYQWKDAQGIWHFSDAPAPDAPADSYGRGKESPHFHPPGAPAEATSETRPEQKGLLWVIKRDGSAPNYLLGTVHSGDERVMRFPPPVREALQNSRSFTMEMIPDAAAMMKLSSAMLLQDGQNLQGLLGDALYTEVVTGMADQGFPEPVVYGMKPWVVLSMLSTPRPETGSFMDLKLYHTALSAGKPVYGLETPEEQIAVFDDISLSDQIYLIRQILDQRPNLKEMTERILEIYLNRDLDLMLGFAQSFLEDADPGITDRFMKRLNADRNQRMAERLISRLREGGAFVAVGALHLPGPEGLLQHLEERGYEVSPLY